MSRLANNALERKRKKEEEEKFNKPSLGDRLGMAAVDVSRDFKEDDDDDISSMDKVSAFADTAADRLAGGVGRGAARITDAVLPGVNTFGLEEFADEWDERAETSREGQKAQGAAGAGTAFGTAAKGTLDAASLVAPSMAASKAIKGTRMFRKAMEGGRASRTGARVGENVVSGVPASAVDVAQEVGRGNDPNALRSAGVGLAVDVAVPLAGAALRGARALAKSGLPQGMADRIAREADSVPPPPDNPLGSVAISGSRADDARAAIDGAIVSKQGKDIGGTAIKGGNDLGAAIDANASKVAVENPQAIGKAFADVGEMDTRNLVLNAVARENSKKNMRGMVKTLVGENADGNTVNRLTRKLTDANTYNDVVKVIDDESARLANITEHTPVPSDARRAADALDGTTPEPKTAAAAVDSADSTLSASAPARFSDDLQMRVDDGAVNPTVRPKPISEIEAGSDSALVGYDELDRARVDEYKSMMQSGEAVDPVVLRVGDDGVERLSDGAHRITAAKELGHTDIPAVRETTPHEMAASVEPHTVASLEAPVEVKVFKPLRDEVAEQKPDFKATDTTHFEEGASMNADEISRLANELGIDLAEFDKNVVRELSKKGVEYGRKEQIFNSISKIAQDTATFAGKTLGRDGTNLVYDLIKGENFMKQHMEMLGPMMRDTQDLINKIINPKSGVVDKIKGTRKSSVAREKLFHNVVLALEDRANAGKYLRNDNEMELFKRFESFFDYFKEMRIAQGMHVEENYRPWVKMMVASDPPKYSITNKRINVDSPFSKERTGDEPFDKIEGDLGKLMHGYAMSQLSEMAYKAPIERFNKNFADSRAWTRIRKQDMDTGLEYINNLLNNAVRPNKKNILERGIDKSVSTVYENILKYNARVALLNLPQRWLSNTQVSKTAVKQAKNMSKELTDEIMPGMAFGSKTVNDMAAELDVAYGGAKTRKISEFLSKHDFEAKSEIANIVDGYKKGFMQGIMDTDPYKVARQQGMDIEQAVRSAMKDPESFEFAARRGNFVVNDTQFGLSKIAKPLMLRAGGSYGRPFQMFIRFPLGMSNFALQSMNSKKLRALEFLKRGNPAEGSLGDLHMAGRAMQDTIEESLQAAKQGVDVNVPVNVLEEQLKVAKKNLAIIDDSIEKLSTTSGKNNFGTMAKMWGAAAAIQVIFDGGMQAVLDDPTGPEAQQAASRSNPTISDRIAGQNSVLGGITSAASPVDKYGGLNERAMLNLVPGVGLAANRGRDIKSIIDSFTGSEE